MPVAVFLIHARDGESEGEEEEEEIEGLLETHDCFCSL